MLQARQILIKKMRVKIRKMLIKRTTRRKIVKTHILITAHTHTIAEIVMIIVVIEDMVDTVVDMITEEGHEDHHLIDTGITESIENHQIRKVS